MSVPLTTAQIETHGAVSARGRAAATREMESVLRHVAEPVVAARLKLTHRRDRPSEERASGQGVIELKGRTLRAVAAAPTVAEVIREVGRRLSGQIEHDKQRRLARRHRGTHTADPHEWRHGDWHEQRPRFLDRPAADREVVRHTSYARRPLDREAAEQELRALDREFHLYWDVDAECDAVVSRRPDGSDVIECRTAAPTGEAHAPPRLYLSEAVEWLDIGDQRWLFFVDAEAGRGSVVYRRNDGHYGVITPATGAPDLHTSTTEGNSMSTTHTDAPSSADTEPTADTETGTVDVTDDSDLVQAAHELRDRFDRWMEMVGSRMPEAFGQRLQSIWGAGRELGGVIKIQETIDDDAVTVHAELPGVAADDIQIEIEDGRLNIAAEREHNEESADEGRFHSEFRYGSYRRSYRLPASARAAEATATYSDGILKVRVPLDGTRDRVERIEVTTPSRSA